MPTDPSERLVELDRVQVAAAFVEHVAGQRCEAGTIARIGGRANRQQDQQADERDGVLLDRPHAQPVSERAPADLWKPEVWFGAERRQSRAVDRHQATVTGSELLSARAARPLGTTLSTTRPSGRSQSRAARCIASGVTCRYRARSRSKNPGSPR